MEPLSVMKLSRDEFTISTDNSRQQVERIHAYLHRSYWAEHIPLELVKRAIDASLCCGIFHQGEQVAFARLVTDRVTFAYLCDVYVLEPYQGQGLGSWLLETVVAHPDLQGLRRLVLVTRDAHSLYAKFGFTELARPERYMEIVRPVAYPPPIAADEMR